MAIIWATIGLTIATGLTMSYVQENVNVYLYVGAFAVGSALEIIAHLGLFRSSKRNVA